MTGRLRTRALNSPINTYVHPRETRAPTGLAKWRGPGSTGVATTEVLGKALNPNADRLSSELESASLASAPGGVGTAQARGVNRGR